MDSCERRKESMKTKVTLEEAQEMLTSRVFPSPAETVPLLVAHQRILAQDIYAPIDQPPFDRSPLDGYALRSSDTLGAEAANPVRLEVIEEVCAGSCPQRELTAGTACRIMTGAPIPKGADCIIRQEDTSESGNLVTISQQLSPGENYCFKGEDIKKGSLLLKDGFLLNYVGIGILASMGFREVPVYRVPKVAVLSTGDELTDIGSELSPGKIYNSNLYTIGLRLKELGMEPLLLGSAPDELDQLCEAITSATRDCDILITLGGVSVGKKDLLKDAMKAVGAEILFWRMNMKPGTPALCSILEGKPVISLSGNPAAAAITFELLARPVLSLVSHHKDVDLHKTEAIMETPYPKESSKRRMLRGKLIQREGQEFVEPGSKHSPGVLSSFSDCNCLIDIPAGTPGLEKGQKVTIFKL
jgi:molybdopterin molybdotransferase